MKELLANEIVISGKKMAAIKKVFFKLLAAGVLGWIVYVLGSFADSIIGGLFLGEEALAAISIVTPISSIIWFSAYLSATGSSLQHAKYIGKNDFKSADRVFSTGVFFNIVLGLLMAVILFFLREPWLNLYGLEGTLRESAKAYYTPFIFMAAFLPILYFIYMCSVGDGDFKFSLASDITTSVLNVILSLVLISVLDIEGLSIASVVSCFIGYLIPLFRFFSKTNTLKLKFTFSFKDLGKSIKLSSSSFLNVLAVAVIDIIMNYYITAKYGAGATAPYAVVNFALEIATALVLVSTSMSTLLNFSIGEENSIDNKAIQSIAKKITLIVGIFFTLFFIALTPFWPSLFGLENSAYIEYAKSASKHIGLSFIATAFFYLIVTYYTAYEKVGFAIISNVLNSFVFPLVLPIVLSTFFLKVGDIETGYKGFVVGFALSNIFSLITVCIILLIKNKGKIFVIPDKGNTFYSIDLIIDTASISKAVECVSVILKENNVDQSISNKVQIIIEESFTLIMMNNKKAVKGRIVLDINDERLKIITKDTGKIFNVIDPDQKIQSLNSFLFTSVVSQSKTSVNYVASNLNGNRYEFLLK